MKFSSSNFDCNIYGYIWHSHLECYYVLWRAISVSTEQFIFPCRKRKEVNHSSQNSCLSPSPMNSHYSAHASAIGAESSVDDFCIKLLKFYGISVAFHWIGFHSLYILMWKIQTNVDGENILNALTRMITNYILVLNKNLSKIFRWEVESNSQLYENLKNTKTKPKKPNKNSWHSGHFFQFWYVVCIDHIAIFKN